MSGEGWLDGAAGSLYAAYCCRRWGRSAPRSARGQGKDGHGAAFPPALPGRCITLSSKEGDVIVDPFVGSGTTAIVAAQLGRRCVAFDISDKYVELTRAQLLDNVGKTASGHLSPDQLGCPEDPASPVADNGSGYHPLRTPATEPRTRTPASRRLPSSLVPASPSTI